VILVSSSGAKIGVVPRFSCLDVRMNYARRQQYRTLSRAASTAAGAAAVAMLGLWLASMGATSIAGVLVLFAIVLGLGARHWLVLAGRSRVGARSEDEVQQALARLEGDGWRLRHSLPWRGRGDIDSVAIVPHRRRVRDRDQVAGVRHWPPGPDPGSGHVALPASAALVP
jgi:hypothetical protein